MNDISQLAFCPELVALLESETVQGRSKAISSKGTLSTLNNLVVLRNLFTALQPKRTLEVGLALGGSTLLFTGCHREGKAPAASQHTAIDPYQLNTYDDAGLLAVESAGMSGYLDFRRTFSHLALPQLVEEGAKFDLIYIDGSHLFEDVFVDMFFSHRLLSDGGVIAFDDCSDPHVKKVMKFILRNAETTLEPVDLSPFRPDKGATLRYRIAKALFKVQMQAFRKIGRSDRDWNSPFKEF